MDDQETGAHRCEGKLRGFGGGQCPSAAAVEHKGKWYCKRHDPTPKKLDGPPAYVWEVWHDRLFTRPIVKRYRLVKTNADGGPTVLIRGSKKVLGAGAGKRFFTDEAKLLAHLKAWVESEAARARERADELTADLASADFGVSVEEVRDEPYPLFKNLKT